jgi:predicted dehydrogenase
MTRAVGADVRIGVIGCGAIAQTVHVPVLKRVRGARVVAVADPSSAAREVAASLVPDAALYEDACTLLDRPDVDAVVVCAPNSLHARLAALVAQAGKHLYLEKPLATDAEEASRAVEAALEAGIVAAIGFNRRVHPVVVRARALLRADAVGTVRTVEGIFCEPLSPDAVWKRSRATGGGALLDLASHHIDLVEFLLDRPARLTAASVSSIDTEHDEASLQLELGDGVEAMLDVSFQRGRCDRLEFAGDRGTLRLDRLACSLELRTGAGRAAPLASGAVLTAWRLHQLLRPTSDPSYLLALKAFVARLRGSAVELPTLEDGLRVLRVVLAAEEAGRRGEKVQNGALSSCAS